MDLLSPSRRFLIRSGSLSVDFLQFRSVDWLLPSLCGLSSDSDLITIYCEVLLRQPEGDTCTACNPGYVYYRLALYTGFRNLNIAIRDRSCSADQDSINEVIL